MSYNIPIEIASIMIPTGNRLLLVPNISVVEILTSPKYVAKDKGPNWYVGNIDWRSLNLVVISLEIMSGFQRQFSMTDKLSYCAVMTGTKNNKKLPYYVIAVDRLPRLLRVIPRDIQSILEQRRLGPGEAMLVKVSNEEAVVPDLDFIEKSILDQLMK